MQELTTGLLYLFALIAILVFLSLGLTAVFRPGKLSTLIEAYKVIALALVGKRYSNHKEEPPTPPVDPPSV